MGAESKIEWVAGDDGSAGSTWNPIRGKKGRWHCTKVSGGCANCYAERLNTRFGGPKYVVGADEFRLDKKALDQPLRWKTPRRVFVCSMTDLFHEQVSDEWIAAIFGVMAAAPQHTFHVLTKRAERMREWFAWLEGKMEQSRSVFPDDSAGWLARHLVTNRARNYGAPSTVQARGDEWPLPNVWIGVSVEDQETTDERIPLLLQTPAKVRWVSYEPALGPVDFECYPSTGCPTGWLDEKPGLGWIVVGGESGPRARPFDVAWARSTVAQCREAGVACFVKQLGAVPVIEAATGRGPEVLLRQREIDGEWPEGTHFGNPTGVRGLNGRVVILRDRKGGEPSEWPEDLRVRQWPGTTTGVRA